jgi:hypothetical protein
MKKRKRIYAKGINHPMYSHGQCINGHSRLYAIWCGMIARCESPKDISYKNYGGRGISVCTEWHDSKTFIEWALSHGYKDNLTIDRVNNDGNYRPDNCRFITRRENIMRRPKKFLWGVYKTRFNRWQVSVGKRIGNIDKLYYGGNYQCIALALMKRDELKRQLDLL